MADKAFTANYRFRRLRLINPYVSEFLNALVDQLDALLFTKSELDSPAFTGTPTAPTPNTDDDSDRIATTAFVKAQNYLTNPVDGGTW